MGTLKDIANQQRIPGWTADDYFNALVNAISHPLPCPADLPRSVDEAKDQYAEALLREPVQPAN